MAPEVLAPPEPKVEKEQKPAVKPPAPREPVTAPPAATIGKQVAEELAKTPYEPFLPVEAKLVTWSLILGVGLLALLVWASNAFFSH